MRRKWNVWRQRRRRSFASRCQTSAPPLVVAILLLSTHYLTIRSPSCVCTALSVSSTPTKSPSTAVILNTNARAVTPSLIPLCHDVFGADNVFLTTNADEARQAAETIVKKRLSSSSYDVVVPVGGDGTLTQTINDFCAAYADQQADKADTTVSAQERAIHSLPIFGYIPMGTGNGVGSSVGCRPAFSKSWYARLFPSRRRRDTSIYEVFQALSLAGDRIRDNPQATRNYNIVEMPMIQVCRRDGNDNNKQQKFCDLCFFAGVGFDSLMLDDFKSVKAWSIKTGFLPRILGSVAGYVVALVALTLPKAVARGEHRVNVRLTTTDRDTLWVDHRRGDFVTPIIAQKQQQNKDGTVELFSGTTGICCAGTSPFYGGGLRLFPFARMTLDKMHLRLGRINPLVGFINIPRIFAGSYREPSERFGCIDFIGKDFDVQVRRRTEDVNSGTEQERGYPFQHSGESQGYFERFRLKVTDGRVRFLNFLPQRCVSCDDDRNDTSTEGERAASIQRR